MNRVHWRISSRGVAVAVFVAGSGVSLYRPGVVYGTVCRPGLCLLVSSLGRETSPAFERPRPRPRQTDRQTDDHNESGYGGGEWFHIYTQTEMAASRWFGIYNYYLCDVIPSPTPSEFILCR